MSNINLKFSEEPLTEEGSISIAKVYQKVFSTPPWNEGYRCSTDCGQTYGETNKPPSQICVCGSSIIDFYGLEDLQKEIFEISRRTGFKIATALGENQKPVGFWYGWDGDLKTLNDQKLNLSNPNLIKLSEVLQERPQQKWFYLAEFGLDPKTRGLGIGKKLCRYGMDQISRQPIILRTNTESPAYYIFRKSGFSTVWKYNDESYRVLMSKPTNND